MMHDQKRKRHYRIMYRKVNGSQGAYYIAEENAEFAIIDFKLRIEIFSVLRTGMDHEWAKYPDPELEGSCFSKERARDHMRVLGDAEEGKLDSLFNTQDVRADHWEAFQDGNSIACFSRIEIVPSRIALEKLKHAGFVEVRQGLDILDELDKFRREHQGSKKHPADWRMRVMEAIVASAYGFGDRMEWVEALKERHSIIYLDCGEIREGGNVGYVVSMEYRISKTPVYLTNNKRMEET